MFGKLQGGKKRVRSFEAKLEGSKQNKMLFGGLGWEKGKNNKQTKEKKLAE